MSPEPVTGASPFGPCQYADVLEYCTQSADTVMSLAPEWGGVTPLCEDHANAMQQHIAATQQKGSTS